AVRAAQTVAATVTCTSTSHHGRWVRYCVSPIAIWTASRPSRTYAARTCGARLRTSQTRSVANARPKTAVARTCQYTAGWNDQSRRTTVLPGCGPDAVASVPLTINTPPATQTRT